MSGFCWKQNSYGKGCGTIQTRFFPDNVARQHVHHSAKSQSRGIFEYLSRL